MHRRTFSFALGATLVAGPLGAASSGPRIPDFTFASIDGGRHDLSAWRGDPVLVVNTASLCAFAPQLDGLQDLHDRYADRGLHVLAVPSDDFHQELGSDKEVRDFCALQFDITLPMASITHVRGPKAHPFYAWVKAEEGFEPDWNFNKILLGPDGRVVRTFGAATRPLSMPMIRSIEALLDG
ncbi:glutathione peroxidase [Tropicimonas sp. IMCC34011]|uniref:glutathione peroxidase n=1 Tax=Tropicimonas sp. IMCC34011 TaxID=2248759 RepID=UPI000E226293|nr:glutathione peroxidase [Tropicimonas sp. IMCC34011]